MALGSRIARARKERRITRMLVPRRLGGAQQKRAPCAGGQHRLPEFCCTHRHRRFFSRQIASLATMCPHSARLTWTGTWIR